MKRLNKIELFLNYGNELKHIEIDLNNTYKQIEELKVYNKNLENIIDEENEEIESLQQEIKELNDSVTWWTNRFNALQRDYEKLKGSDINVS